VKNSGENPSIARRAPSRDWRWRVGILALLLALGSPALAQEPGEIEFWKSVQNSKNPAELQAYLDTYPHGRFVALARLRIAQLTGKPAPGPAQQPAPPTAKEETPVSPPSPPVSESMVRETPTAPANPGEATAGSVALGAAIRAGDIGAVKAAVADGVDINAWDDKGMPPIGLAALLGKPDIIVFLAAHGADVNRNDRFGFTPLMNAAIRGQPEAARILIALGADPTLKGGNGNDPTGAARPNGPSDRRYDGKIAVGKVLEAAVAARSSGGVRQ
jgi:hypothetical protein